MRSEVSAMEARQRLGELLERAFYQNDEIVIKRGNKKMGVLISPRAYERYCEQRAKDFEALERIWEGVAPISQEEADRIAQEMVDEVRAEESQRSDARRS